MITETLAVATSRARLLVVQWGGDYREAYHRLEAGGEETYYAQRYSVSQVAEVGRSIDQAGVLCCFGEETYDEVLGNGVRAMGAGLGGRRPEAASALGAIERFDPTHMVVATPKLHLLRWGLRRDVEVLPIFADTFHLDLKGLSPPRRLLRGWRQRHYLRRLGSTLSDSRIRWVSNHNFNASRQLVEIGVPPGKVVPWDWPPVHRPDMYDPRSGPAGDGPWRLVFAGAASASKGVGDLIDAVSVLSRRGRDVDLRVLGPGDLAPLVAQAEGLGVAGRVHFEGRRPHPEVIAAMREADVVLVPSRHESAEGIPMVIYEALTVRTPLLCSDHPAFRGRIGEGEASLTFPAGQPSALADAIERVLREPGLYGRMSRASAEVWGRLQCPVRIWDLIRRWLSGDPEDDRWLADHSLASGRYPGPAGGVAG